LLQGEIMTQSRAQLIGSLPADLSGKVCYLIGNRFDVVPVLGCHPSDATRVNLSVECGPVTYRRIQEWFAGFKYGHNLGLHK
jgi:hypothetical protein